MNALELAEFNRVHISARDFKRALEFIAEAGKHDVASLLHESLLLSAIIYYVRPFTHNEKDKTSPTSPKLVVDTKGILGGDVTLHDRLLLIRNKAIAHAEFEYYPVQAIPPIDDFPDGASSVSRSWHVVNECIDLEAFARIAHAMRRYCLMRSFDIRRAATIAAKAL